MRAPAKQAARPPHPDDWRPNPGPQTRFLSLAIREALYGGAAGGGKSECLLVDAIRYVGRGYGAWYAALLLRRTYPELEKSLVQRSHILYPRLGGRYNGQLHCWTFPEGEKVWFGYCDHEKDVTKYQSDEFQFIGFDELTHFTESQYVYLGFSRMRSSKGIPLRLRAGTNPGGDGHDWVFRRFAPWLDPDSEIKAKGGEVLHFVRNGESEVLVPKGTPKALGRCFVPARVEDNPHVNEEYVTDLDQLDIITRSQLRDGNWLIKPGKGLLFKRTWFEVVGQVPDGCRFIRYWDLAATQDGGDWTVGTLLGIDPDGIVFVADVIRLQGSPATVEKTVRQTAEIDGHSVAIGLPQDPGQAGKSQADAYAKLLQGYNVRFLRETGDKVTRSKPLSAQAERRRVKIVRGDWNLHWLCELEGFPEWSNDDQVDSASNAYSMIVGGKKSASYTSSDLETGYRI